MEEKSSRPDRKPKEILESSSQENVVWGSTEHLSERRFKNLQRDEKRGRRRFNTIPGEEKGYSSESDNDLEDRNNSLYDSRLPPEQERQLQEWQWKIRKIKSNDLPKEYVDTRTELLQEAEDERIKNGTVPAYLHDVQPPWNKWIGLAITRYNEMIIMNLSTTIEYLREQNAAACAIKDTANKKHGPRDGQGRR